MKVTMIRTMSGLSPADAEAELALAGVRINFPVLVEVIRARNIKHHRLFWAMCSKVGRAMGLTAENVADVLKLHTGHYTLIKTERGTYKVPKSISFAAMDQAQFREFYDRCCEVICFEFLPHMNAAQVRTEVLNMMGINWQEATDDEKAA